VTSYREVQEVKSTTAQITEACEDLGHNIDCEFDRVLVAHYLDVIE
jgi:hypothetical protein